MSPILLDIPAVLKRSVQTGFEFQSVDNWLQWEPQLAHFI